MKSSHPTRDPQGHHTALYMLIFFFMETIFFCHSSRCRVETCFETSLSIGVLQQIATGNTLQYTASHCNALQQTATQCTTLQHTAALRSTLQHNATHYSTRHHTSIHCNALQHTAIHSHPPKSTTKTGFSHKKTHQCRETTNDSHPHKGPAGKTLK